MSIIVYIFVTISILIFYYLTFILRHDVLSYVLPEKLFLFIHSLQGKNEIVSIKEEFDTDMNINKDETDTIPNIFVQTMKSMRTTKRHYEKIKSFKKYHPGFSHYIFDDKKMEEFMLSREEKISTSFSKLTQGAMKADLFRLVYLYEYGGYYFDADSYISSKLPVKTDDDLLIFRVDTHVIQWSIICKKKHPIIKRAIEISCNNILNDNPTIDRRYPEPKAAGYAGPVVLGHAIEKTIGFNIKNDIDTEIPKETNRRIRIVNLKNEKGIHHKYAGYEADMILMKQKKWKSNKM